MALGRVQPPGLSKGHRSGWFEGQRPGLIPAYGIAIGIGHRNGWRAESPVSCPGFVVGTDGSGLQPLDRFNARFPGAVPQAGMVRTFGARVGKGQRPGLFEGQRPGLIPAYGIAIGIGHRNGWRAESPVSCPGFVVGTDGSGLQSLRCFNAPFRGAIPQAGMVRTVGAGEGGELRMEADEHEWGGARGEPSPFFSAAQREIFRKTNL